MYIKEDDIAMNWTAVFHFDSKVTSSINSSDLMLSLKPDTNISLNIIIIDDTINKSLNLLISGIKVKITRSLSAMGSKTLPISVSRLFFLASHPSKKSVIEANIKSVKATKYNTPIDRVLSNNKSNGIIMDIKILEEVRIFGIKEP